MTSFVNNANFGLSIRQYLLVSPTNGLHIPKQVNSKWLSLRFQCLSEKYFVHMSHQPTYIV